MLTPTQIAKRLGMHRRMVLDMMNPDHPQHIPNINVPTRSGRPRYRVEETTFESWYAAHFSDIEAARDAGESEGREWMDAQDQKR